MTRFCFLLVAFAVNVMANAQTIKDNWWIGVANDSVKGIGLSSASEYVGRLKIAPVNIVKTAVIDSGFDVEHPFFSGGTDAVVWDDARWNFLGNDKGEVIEKAGTEAFRYFKALYPKYKNVSAEQAKDSAEFAFYQEVKRAARINSYLMYAEYQAQRYKSMVRMDSVVKVHYPDSTATLSDFIALEIDTTGLNTDIQTVSTVLIKYERTTPWATVFKDMKDEYELSSKRVASLERNDDDPHLLLGNNPEDFSNLHYGNNIINGTPDHGTMVSGLVAFMNQQLGVQPSILPIRAIPDGDEYDRDVAAAIRLAVEQGAKVVNMSFGKNYSPNREEVDKAIQLAADNDVLIIKSAGNDKSDNDVMKKYPASVRVDNTHWQNMVSVAATDRDGSLASFSCYGKNAVDVAAPGAYITSAKAGGRWITANGTSFSGPIVAGLASTIRSYFPDLTASEVRNILIASSDSSEVLKDKCISGGIINAERAMQMAYEQSRYGGGAMMRAQKIGSDAISRTIHNRSLFTDWLDKEGRYIHYELAGDNESENVHYLFDTKKKQKTALFDNQKLCELLTPFAKEDRKPLKGKVYVQEMKIANGGKDIRFTYNEKRLAYNIASGTLAECDADDVMPRRQYGVYPDRNRSYSADSTYYVTCWGHDLYLYNVAKGDSVQLSSDGEHFYSFSVAGSGNYLAKKTDRTISAPAGTWVGNSHVYVIMREDKRNVETMTIVDNLAERPKAITYKFPTPGDSIVSKFELYILDADKAEMKKQDIDAYEDQMLEVPRFGTMTKSGNNVYFLRKSRYQDQLDLCCVNAEEKQMKVLIHEDCAPHLNEQLFNFHVLNKGNDILWWSERNGKGQYFLYDGKGNLRNAVTPKGMVAGSIEHIDTIGKQLYLAGYGYERDTHPTYVYHYRVGMNGKGLVCLTPVKGNHSVNFNPAHTVLIDECSAIDQAPVHRIYDNKGHLLSVLAECSLDSAHALGWHEPKAVKVTAADGVTPLYGVVYTPSCMRSDDKFPIISNPYPGPQMDQVPEYFTIDDNGNQTLAEMGFVVINFSYRGSNPLRGRDFYTHGYGNLRDYAIDDDMATIRQVAEMIPQADTTRVGIFGHSGGGFMTATALMLHPEFYKVGVAASGNYDNNIYTKWWGETFHGRGKIPTTIELAPNLQGKLLLITGDKDNNVHPANTMRLANALIKANKKFDLFIMPGFDHGMGGRYYENLIRDYFIKHLK